MTVKELYEWAKENNAENLDIVVSTWGDFANDFEITEGLIPDIRTIDSCFAEDGHILNMEKEELRKVKVVCLS